MQLSTALGCCLVLLAGFLGSCQRASYQFQHSTDAAYRAVPPAPLAGSAVIAMTASPVLHPAGRPGRGRLFSPRSARHPAKRRNAARAKIPLVPRRWVAVVAMQPPAHGQFRQEPTVGSTPVHHRSRGVALLLAILAITYLPLSLHNFYLGYYGRGAAAIALLLAGIYLLLLGSLGIVFGPANLLAVGYIGIALLAGWFFWQVSDLIRIINRSLQPKNGEYNPRFL